MDLDFSTLFAGFILGVIGIYLLKEGRRLAHVPWILLGVVMMVYPYFVPGPWLVWAVGGGLVFVAYRMK